MNNLDLNKREFNFRDIEAIIPLRLKNYNHKDYSNITRSDYWFVFDNINNIASDPKSGIVVLTRDQLRKKSEMFVAKYSKSNLSDIVVLQQYYKKRADRADKTINKWITVFLHLFGRKSNAIPPKIEIHDENVYSTGGCLPLWIVKLFANAINHENLSIMIVFGLSRLLDREILLNGNSKRKGRSTKTASRTTARKLYDTYRYFFMEKYVEKRKQTEEYGATKYAGDETAKEILKKEGIVVKPRNIIDAMRRRKL